MSIKNSKNVYNMNIVMFFKNRRFCLCNDVFINILIRKIFPLKVKSITNDISSSGSLKPINQLFISMTRLTTTYLTRYLRIDTTSRARRQDIAKRMTEALSSCSTSSFLAGRAAVSSEKICISLVRRHRAATRDFSFRFSLFLVNKTKQINIYITKVPLINQLILQNITI